MCWPPARSIRCANSSNWPSPMSAAASSGAVGAEEKGIDARSGQVLVEVDPRYFRPTEVDLLLGDPAKARQKARLAAQDQLRGAGEGDGRSRSRGVRREKERRNRHD